MRRVLSITESVKGRDHCDLAAVLLDLSAIVRTQHRYREAELLAARGQKIAEATVGEETVVNAQGLCILAGAISAQGGYTNAEPLYRRALTIFLRAVGEDDLRTASALSDLATLRCKQGDDAEASLLYKRALRIEERLSRDTLQMATTLSSYAKVLRHQKLRHQAAEMEQKARVVLDAFQTNSAARTVDAAELK